MSLSLSRRGLFGLATATAAAACPLCPDAHAETTPHWSYEGLAAPAKWGELSPDFKTCSLGVEQTPIDLKSGIRARSGTVDIRYPKIPLTILNNGHTIQVNTPPGGRLAINGTDYDLVQFHFHHPSEHLLDGRRFPQELHFVHKRADGVLAVIGVFVEEGRSWFRRGDRDSRRDSFHRVRPTTHSAGEHSPRWRLLRHSRRSHLGTNGRRSCWSLASH